MYRGEELITRHKVASTNFPEPRLVVLGNGMIPVRLPDAALVSAACGHLLKSRNPRQPGVLRGVVRGVVRKTAGVQDVGEQFARQQSTFARPLASAL